MTGKEIHEMHETKNCVDCGAEKKSDKGNRCGFCARSRAMKLSWATKRDQIIANQVAGAKRSWQNPSQKRIDHLAKFIRSGRGRGGRVEKFTDAQAEEIRASTETVRRLAVRYGDSIGTIYNVRKRNGAYAEKPK